MAHGKRGRLDLDRSCRWDAANLGLSRACPHTIPMVIFSRSRGTPTSRTGALTCERVTRRRRLPQLGAGAQDVPRGPPPTQIASDARADPESGYVLNQWTAALLAQGPARCHWRRGPGLTRPAAGGSSLSCGGRVVLRVNLRVPPGHRGLPGSPRARPWPPASPAGQPRARWPIRAARRSSPG